MVRKTLAALRQGGIAGEGRAALPAARAVAFPDRGVSIFAERCSERPLVAGFGLEARDRGTAALLQGPCERVMFGFRRGQRRACRGEAAFRRIPAFGGVGAALLRFHPRGFCLSKRLRSGLGSQLGIGTSALLLASVAQCRELFRELGALLSGPGELRPRGVQRGFGDPALGAHGGLPGKQFRERCLGFTRACLRAAELRHDARGARLRILQPLLDRGTLHFELRDGSAGVALQRLLARNVAGERSIEAV